MSLEIKRYASATEFHKADNTIVLLSYNTPVAAFIPGEGFYQTIEFYSRTTSKHMSQFFARHGSKRTPLPITAQKLQELMPK